MRKGAPCLPSPDILTDAASYSVSSHPGKKETGRALLTRIQSVGFLQEFDLASMLPPLSVIPSLQPLCLWLQPLVSYIKKHICEDSWTSPYFFCGGQNRPFADVHTLFYRTCVYVTMWQRDFAELIKTVGLKIGRLSWIIPVGLI